MPPGFALSTTRLYRETKVTDYEPVRMAKATKLLWHPTCELVEFGTYMFHGRYTTFQMAKVAVPRQMFQEILM